MTTSELGRVKAKRGRRRSRPLIRIGVVEKLRRRLQILLMRIGRDRKLTRDEQLQARQTAIQTEEREQEMLRRAVIGS